MLCYWRGLNTVRFDSEQCLVVFAMSYFALSPRSTWLDTWLDRLGLEAVSKLAMISAIISGPLFVLLYRDDFKVAFALSCKSYVH